MKPYIYAMPFIACAACMISACTQTSANTPPPPTTPVLRGEVLPDTDGNHVNAHGGCILEYDGTYYWYGEQRSDRHEPQQGVACYTSTDLRTWTNRGIVLSVTDEPGSPIERGCIIERPKVVYNPATGKFVMWFHNELKDKGYAAAQAGVAIADNPTGPFELIRSARVNPGKYPLGTTEEERNRTWSEDLEWWTPDWYKAIDEGMFCYRDVPGGQMARDMTVYIDDDGRAYHIYSAEDNLTLNIAELDSTYTDHTGRYIRVAPAGHNEAPTIFKHDGTYWMITSGCTGWAPNAARLMRADSIMGQWEVLPNPCRGFGADLTFGSQGTSVFSNGDTYTFMADRWHPKNLADSRHLWLPIHFDSKGVPYLTMPPAEEDKTAALMVYFTDPTHDLFMATSPDGYTFTAVNDGKPVIAGDSIALQHGIRDPHIARGADGAFYLAMTDLHIFGKDKGLRDTEWERPGEDYGWGNNHGLVLMKSYDLINWSRSNVNIDILFPDKFGDIGCAWAPESVYDPAEGKMMVYFTMRHGNGRTKLYYAYADPDFTTLVTEPKILFEYPDENIQVLDADITQMPDGRWCMAYVAQDGPSGVKIATGDSPTGPWEYQDAWVDAEEASCEAPNVWRRPSDGKYVLMYDIFGIQPHNFGFVETEDFKTFTPAGRFNEDGPMKATNFSSPKHGAVIAITPAEKERLEEYWAAK